MIGAINRNQQEPAFQARFRLKKKKSIKTPVLLSTFSVFSTGAVSGYGFGHYGKDVFKPTFYKEKIIHTTQKFNNKWLTIKNKMSNIEIM